MSEGTVTESKTAGPDMRGCWCHRPRSLSVGLSCGVPHGSFLPSSAESSVFAKKAFLSRVTVLQRMQMAWLRVGKEKVETETEAEHTNTDETSGSPALNMKV